MNRILAWALSQSLLLPTLLALLLIQLRGGSSRAAEVGAPIRVLVWDEQQPAQKQAYTNFLGNEIAAHLGSQPGLAVASATLDDPRQGLSSLEQTDVLIWWGHVRQGEIQPETAREIIRRVREGKLALIALHSAHWSEPFVEAMRERARLDALAALAPEDRATAVMVESNLFPNFRIPPKYDTRLTPAAIYRKKPSGPVEVRLTLPNCCFPAYRADGQPSQMRALRPGHPLAQGIPAAFIIEQTEMYDEPFHVPPPDEVVFEERWVSGEWFRSGMVWNLGRGRVFYFRPGHETYPVFKNPQVLRILDNAVRWLGAK